MPVTRNVAWDGRLESFKGPDTTLYVLTAADLAKTCAACEEPLRPGEQLSLLVNITQSKAPTGTQYLTFTDSVCHRRCSEPTLSVEQAPWQPQELFPVPARFILTQASGPDWTRQTAVLAFTVVPVVTFREHGGERVSALVTLLISHGFQLVSTPDYDQILEQAEPVAADCSFMATPEGLILFRVAGTILYRDQLELDPATNDVQWLHTARTAGRILVISGDNLDITDKSIDLQGAARQGTLVIGTVPFSEGH